MKTLDEATELFMIKVAGVNEPLDMNRVEKANEVIESNHSRYQEIIKEAQLSPKIEALAEGFVGEGIRLRLPLVALIMLVISHSIPIGIEMEKQDAITPQLS